MPVLRILSWTSVQHRAIYFINRPFRCGTGTMAGGAWVNGVYSKVERTATWDYLQAFIDEGHKLNLKVHAGFNTMAGGAQQRGG